MAETYQITTPNNTNEFQYLGKTYGPNNTFETSNACEAIGFYNALRNTNPDIGRANSSPDAWETMERDCNAIQAADPVDSGPGTPVESKPTDADSSVLQGANSGPDGGLANARTDDEEDFIPPTEEPERPEDGKPTPDISGERSQESTTGGDPVDLFTGAFAMQETDLEIANTLLPMQLTRVYRSGIAAFGPFGWNWDHNFNIYLRVLTNGNIAVWRNLHEDIFTFDGNEYMPPRGIFEKISRLPGLGDEYEIEGRGGVLIRFKRPPGWLDVERIPVVWIGDRFGNRINFTYGNGDHLIKVEDEDDRYFDFVYDECGLITSIRDHTNRKYRYEHNEETKQLTCVISPPLSDFPEGLARIYHYEEPWTHQKLRHNIVRIEDSHGNVYLENTYEHDPAAWDFARVKEQLYGGFLYQFCYKELQYVTPNPLFVNISSVQVQVLNPDYGLEIYTFNYRGDLLDQRYRLNKDRSYRVVVWQYEYDSQGNKISITRPDGSQELFIYDNQHAHPAMRGNLLRKELTAASGFPAPSRIIWRGTYESRYQLLVSEKNEVNAETVYKYDFDLTPANPTNSGKLKEIHYADATLPNGNIQKSATKLKYNNRGQLSEVTLPDGTIHELVYGLAGKEKSRLITQRFDISGNNIEHHFRYDIYGNMTESVDGNGNITSFDFNLLGLIEKYHLPPVNGNEAGFGFRYNADKKVISTTKPIGSFTEDGLTDDFLTDEFDRDILGYPIFYLLASNTSQSRPISICNDFRGLPVRISNPDNSTIRKSYDERGLLLEENITGENNELLKASNIYDRFGRVIQSSDFNGNTVEYEYDGFSRLHRKILSNGTIVENTWGPGDVLVSVETIGEDGHGGIRQLTFLSYTYDEKGRTTEMKEKIFTDNPGTSIDRKSVIFYDTLDRVTKEINPLGGETIYQYDGMNRITSTTDPGGNKENLTYDQNGNVIHKENIDIEPDGSQTSLSISAEYDERNRLVAIIEPDGSRYTQKLDDRDLLIEETDPLGITNTKEYDAHRSIVKEVFDVGGLQITQRWQHDAMSRPTSFIDPMGQVSTYDRDGLGRISQTVYPNGFSSVKAYNDIGLVSTETLGSGTKFNYTYDSGNRIQQIINSYTPPTIHALPTHTFTYDGLNRLITAQVDGQTVKRLYDSGNRIVKETTHGDDITRSYNDISGIFYQKWPDGRMEKYYEDNKGIIRQIEETTHSGIGNQLVNIASINPSGAQKTGEVELGTGVKMVYQFDERKRLISNHIRHPNGVSIKLENRYDAANRKRIESIHGPLSKDCLHDFDNKDRVVGTTSGLNLLLSSARSQTEHDQAIQDAVNAAMAAVEKKSFSYSDGDERIKETENGLPDKNYTYDTGHKITSDGIDSYTHHSDGTLKNKGAVQYEIDALGRIILIKSGGETLCELKYDALGRPSIIRQKTEKDRYLNYFGKSIYQEKSTTGILRQITLHPNTGIPISYHYPGKSINPIIDTRFNLIGIIDDQGQLLESYDYSTFGKPSIYDATGNPIASSSLGINPIFGGQQYLHHTGLYLSGKRLMNPDNGLFLSADVMGYADSSSLYVYTGQNPVDNIDPEGDLAFLAGLLIAAVVGAVISGGVNAARQGIAIAEGSQEGWEWGQFGTSVGVGAIAGPLLVVAPELAVPLAIYGVGQGAVGIAEGNYATGAFDIVASVVPFGSKGVRNTTFGRGSVFGKGPRANIKTRFGRFNPGNAQRVSHVSKRQNIESIKTSGKLKPGEIPRLEGGGKGVWISPFETARLSFGRRIMTGLLDRHRVEFDVFPGEVQNPGGIKTPFFRWQRIINTEKPIDLSGRNPSFGKLPLFDPLAPPLYNNPQIFNKWRDLFQEENNKNESGTANSSGFEASEPSIKK